MLGFGAVRVRAGQNKCCDRSRLTQRGSGWVDGEAVALVPSSENKNHVGLVYTSLFYHLPVLASDGDFE